jgi:hypothetical protein
MTEPKPRYRLQDAVDEVLNSQLFKSGEAFTIAEMKEVCTTVSHESRMSEVLRIMHEHGLVTPIGSNINLMYKKPGTSWMRKPIVSEVAESLRDGDIIGRLTGEAARDALISARVLSSISSLARRDSL